MDSRKNIKKRNLFNALSLGIAIISVGIGPFIVDHKIVSIILILFGFSIVIVVAFVNFMLPYLIDKIDLLKDPKIFKKSSDSGQWVTDTYELAKRNGGVLYATHIYQHRIAAKDDLAYKSLQGEVSEDLKFYRILIFDNQHDEIEWIENLLAMQSDKLAITVYFWKYINLMVNRFTIGIIPRINILAYSNKEGTRFRTLIGFEKVRSASDVDKHNLNLAIASSKKSIYELIIAYFTKIQEHPEMQNAIEISSYQIKKSHFPIPPSEQSVLKEIINLSHKTDSILHFGTFGHTALTLNNICIVKRKLNHYSDVDILLVANTSQDEIKRLVLEKIDSRSVEVIFGFDDDYFYHFRDTNKITVDIEIFEKESNYYKINRLLGYSIFSNYYTLYSFEHLPLADLIDLPLKPIDKSERGYLVKNDRKGIIEFINRLENDNSNLIDPRRVLTHSIKNFNWYLTGHQTYEVQESIDYIQENELLTKNEIFFVQEILGFSTNLIKENYNDTMNKTIEILRAINDKIE